MNTVLTEEELELQKIYKEYPNPPADGQAGIPQCRQRKQRRHSRAFVIHGAPAENPTVPDLTAPGVKAPIIPGRHHVQMAQHGNHFLAGTILAPAHMTVHIHGVNPKGLRRGQHMVKTLSNLPAIGRALLRLPLHAGNPQIFPQAL